MSAKSPLPLVALLLLTLINGARASTCPLTVGIWVNDPPFFYREKKQWKGIYRDIFDDLSHQINCPFKTVYLPPSRVKNAGDSKTIDITLYIQPLDRDMFSGQPKYIKGMPVDLTVRVSLGKQPILIGRMGYISLKNKKILLNNEDDFKRYRIGSITHNPHLADTYWQDLAGIPSSPIGYKTILQGLRAVAANRIDLFFASRASLPVFESRYGKDELAFAHEIRPMRVSYLLYTARLGEEAEQYRDLIDKSLYHLWKSGKLRSIVEKHSSSDFFYWPKDNNQIQATD